MYYTELGYDNYEGYLDGKEWQELHRYFYYNCGKYRCRICGLTQNLVLHKRTYDHLTLWSLKIRFLFLKPLMVRWLQKHFVWLCRSHNKQVHFYDNGRKVPLTYSALWKREQEVYKRYHSLWRLIRKTRPSDVLGAIGNFIAYSME